MTEKTYESLVDWEIVFECENRAGGTEESVWTWLAPTADSLQAVNALIRYCRTPYSDIELLRIVSIQRKYFDGTQKQNPK